MTKATSTIMEVRGYALESSRRMVFSGVYMSKDLGRGPTDPSPRVGGG